MTEIFFDKIRLYKNFLNEDELRTLNDYANNTPEEIWNQSNMHGQDWVGKVLVVTDQNVQNTLDGITNKIKNLFEDGWYLNFMNRIQRFNTNLEPIGLHRDVDGYGKIKYGCVLYLNDNYDGGEICYPDFNFEFKPIKGCMVIHPGDLSHYVNPITNGSNRYIITNFVHHETKDSFNFKE